MTPAEYLAQCQVERAVEQGIDPVVAVEAVKAGAVLWGSRAVFVFADGTTHDVDMRATSPHVEGVGRSLVDFHYRGALPDGRSVFVEADCPLTFHWLSCPYDPNRVEVAEVDGELERYIATLGHEVTRLLARDVWAEVAVFDMSAGIITRPHRTRQVFTILRPHA